MSVELNTELPKNPSQKEFLKAWDVEWALSWIWLDTQETFSNNWEFYRNMVLFTEEVNSKPEAFDNWICNVLDKYLIPQSV
jgi:hypothetical protein